MKISPLDVQIIELFQEDARIPVVQVARRLGIAESTARHRVNRLAQGGVLQFAAWVNPPELPDHVWTLIDLGVDMRDVDEVARRLCAIEQIYFVAITSGSYEIRATAVFSSNKEMLEFIRGPLAEIPGIVRVSTSTVVKLVKRTPMYAAPWKLIAEGQQTTTRKGPGRPISHKAP